MASSIGSASGAIAVLRRVFRLSLVVPATAWMLGSCAFSGGGGSDVPNSLGGTVVASDGIPVANASVRIRSRSWTPRSPEVVWSTQTDENGRYNLPAFPNLQDLVVEWEDSLDGIGAVLAMDPSWQEADRIPTVTLLHWGTLAGTCVSDSSGVISTDRLYIPELGREIGPDSTGAWNFSGIPPGTYSPVLVSRPPFESFRFPPHTVVEGARTLVAPILLADSSRGTWRGVATHPDGSLASGVRMTWTDSLRSLTYGMLATSDDSGRMLVPLPPPGRWTYRWSAPGESNTLRIDIPDTTKDLRRTLPTVVVLRR